LTGKLAPIEGLSYLALELLKIEVSRVLIPLFLIISFPKIASGQQTQTSVAIGVSYGSYALKDLRDFQDLTLLGYSDFFGPELKSTTRFPAQPAYELSFLVSSTRWSFGLTTWRSSTGARTDYQDYSGFWRLDMVVLVNGIRARVNYNFKETKKGHYYVTMQPGVGFNKLKMTEHLFIQSLTDESATGRSTSHNVIIIPGLGYRHSLTNRIFLLAEAKYEWNISNSELRIDENSFLPPPSVKGNPAKVRWDGIRLAVNIGYDF